MALAVDGLNWVDVDQWYNPGWGRKSGSWSSEVERVGGQILKSCSRSSSENQLSAENWVPKPPVEQPRRTRKTHCYGWTEIIHQFFAVCFLASMAPPLGAADWAEGILGFCGPASGPTLKKALSHICPVVGRRINKWLEELVGSIYCSLCSVSNSPLTHNTFNKVKGIFF